MRYTVVIAKQTQQCKCGLRYLQKKKYVNTKRITSIMSGESLCSRLHGLIYIDAVAHETNSKSPMESFGLTCPQSHIMKAQPAKLEKLLRLAA